jgi:hypothetical protein
LNEPGQDLSARQAAAFEALAAKYPEVADAVARGGKPMDVDDQVLAEQIYKDYIALLTTDLPARLQPLIDALMAEGADVKTSPGLPAVTAVTDQRGHPATGDAQRCRRGDAG